MQNISSIRFRVTLLKMKMAETEKGTVETQKLQFVPSKWG